MTITYRVTFHGQVLEGHSIDSVKQRLATAFRLTPANLAQLFSGAEVVIKRTLDESEARQLHDAMRRLGALTTLDFDFDLPSEPTRTIGTANMVTTPRVSIPASTEQSGPLTTIPTQSNSEERMDSAKPATPVQGGSRAVKSTPNRAREFTGIAAIMVIAALSVWQGPRMLRQHELDRLAAEQRTEQACYEASSVAHFTDRVHEGLITYANMLAKRIGRSELADEMSGNTRVAAEGMSSVRGADGTADCSFTAVIRTTVDGMSVEGRASVVFQVRLKDGNTLTTWKNPEASLKGIVVSLANEVKARKKAPSGEERYASEFWYPYYAAIQTAGPYAANCAMLKRNIMWVRQIVSPGNPAYEEQMERAVREAQQTADRLGCL
jgi:hypothetical protein